MSHRIQAGEEPDLEVEAERVEQDRSVIGGVLLGELLTVRELALVELAEWERLRNPLISAEKSGELFRLRAR
jgi:hypothetical protein